MLSPALPCLAGRTVALVRKSGVNLLPGFLPCILCMSFVIVLGPTLSCANLQRGLLNLQLCLALQRYLICRVQREVGGCCALQMFSLPISCLCCLHLYNSKHFPSPAPAFLGLLFACKVGSLPPTAPKSEEALFFKVQHTHPPSPLL